MQELVQLGVAIDQKFLNTAILVHQIKDRLSGRQILIFTPLISLSPGFLETMRVQILPIFCLLDLKIVIWIFITRPFQFFVVFGPRFCFFSVILGRLFPLSYLLGQKFFLWRFRSLVLGKCHFNCFDQFLFQTLNISCIWWDWLGGTGISAPNLDGRPIRTRFLGRRYTLCLRLWPSRPILLFRKFVIFIIFTYDLR